MKTCVPLLLFLGCVFLISCQREVHYTTQSAGSTYNEYKASKYDKVKYKEMKPGSKKR